MKLRILVLNDDSFAATTVCDERLSHGFRNRLRCETVRDFISSPRSNRMLALSTILNEQVGFSGDDCFKTSWNLDDVTQPAAAGISWEQLRQSELMANCDFFTLDEFSVLDGSYARSHFDGIFFFFTHRFAPKLHLPDELNSLMSHPECPPCFIFNLCLTETMLAQLASMTAGDEARGGESCSGTTGLELLPQLNCRVFWQQVLPQAAFIHTLTEDSATAVKTWLQQPAEVRDTTDAVSRGDSNKAPVVVTGGNAYLMFNQLMVQLSRYQSGLMIQAAADNQLARLQQQLPVLGQQARALVSERISMTFGQRLSIPQGSVGSLSRSELPFTVVISSQLFNRHALLGLSPYAERLLTILHHAFPQAVFKAVISEGIYSYSPILPGEALLLKPHNCIWKSAGNAGQILTASINQALTALRQARLLAESDFDFNELLLESMAVTGDDETGGSGGIPAATAPAAAAATAPAEPQLAGCCICFDSDDFRQMIATADLVVTDRNLEQLVAAGLGVPCLGLRTDVDLSGQIEQRLFLALEYVRHGRQAQAVSEAEMMYPYFCARKALAVGAKIGIYQDYEDPDFGCEQVSPILSLSQLLAENALGPVLSKAVLSAENRGADKTGCMSEEGLKLVQTLVNKLSDRLYPLHPQEQLVMLREQLKDQDKARTDCAVCSDHKIRSAQRSSYTSYNRYDVQWHMLTYLMALRYGKGVLPARHMNGSWFAPGSLKVMSFGCARGFELNELRCLFGRQHYYGVDISEDALEQARKLWQNLGTRTADFSWDFMTPEQLEAVGIAKTTVTAASGAGYDLQCDVVTAMTVLCRHPDTLNLNNASEVYPFAEFEQGLKLLDRHLKPGGILCLFNGNYRLEDTDLASRYARLFPWPEGVPAALVNATCEDMALSSAAMALYREQLNLFAEKKPGHLEIPAWLLQGLEQQSADGVGASALYGYTVTFAPDGNRIRSGDKGTIFLKLS